MKNSTILAAATAALSVAAIADDLYLNDFATRTSKEPIPAIGVWQTATPYPASSGFLCYRPVGSDKASWGAEKLSTYFSSDQYVVPSGRPCVDGWFMPYYNASYKLQPRYYPPFSGSLSENPVFTWAYGSTSDDRMDGVAVHTLNNEFTNGQIRIQVDMKAPVKWFRKSADLNIVSTIKIFPVYRKYMDILAWNGDLCDTTASPGKFGFRSSGNYDDANSLRSFPQYWDTQNLDNGTTQLGNNDNNKNGPTNYWYRFIVTYDLDNNTFSGETYRFMQDKGHPSFDTVPSDSNPRNSFSNKTVMAPLTAETGGIAGLAISGRGRFRGSDASRAENKGFVDNIRISWKAPGASNFEIFYENDFSTRRYRTLCAPSSTSGAYSQSTAAANETDTYTYPSFSGNLDRRQLFPETVNGTSASQPAGLDGWKKLPYRNHSGSAGNAAILAYGGTTYDADGVGTNMLTYGNQGNFSIMGQTLGKVFTTGKVKISVDARLPEGDNLTTSITRRRMAIGLGSLALYDTAATSADACAQIAAGFGYHRLENTGICSSKPYTLSAYTSGDEPTRNYPASYTAPETNAWYRMVVEADLDAKTYDVSMTPLGTASVLPDFVPVESPIFTATDLPFAANVANIGSFYLYGYGYGASVSEANAHYIKSRVCFDNIRVYHNSDLVYENDFTTRTRTLISATRETGYPAALQYNLDGGQDHWVRRDYIGPSGFDARAWVRDNNGNKFLALGRSAESGRTITLVNGLGLSQTKPFRFEADIRPPSQWSAASGSATISLGDSQMLQTEAPESVYGAHRLVTFGFSGTNTASTTVCPYYFAGCKAKVGNTELDAEIDTTHWYRFRLEVNPEAGTYDAKVIDMGTAHPTAETKGGTVVGTVSNVAFANSLAAGEGVSTIHIAGDGLAGAYGSLGVDPAHILIDNLRLSVPSPFVLSVR
ncbi:MAG: hypothetical protein ILM98_01905 [Kiritimatiellae bacterium]|nr:hypothetical protein [Kiritimatiellia bacterium]